MDPMDDLDRELAEALAAAEKVALTPEETERGRKLAALDEARAARRAAAAARRKIEGDKLEREARAEAAGRYQVRFFDLGSLLPDVDPAAIPGSGILVFRSHPPDAKKAWDREAEAKARDLSDINADLVCASIVRPKFQGAEAVRFRGFLESDLGCGLANQMLGPVLDLGGARSEEVKRGRK